MEIGRMGEVPRNNAMPEGLWLVVYGGRTHYQIGVEDWRDHEAGFVATVTDKYRVGSEVMLADVPHSRVELYQDKVPVRMMREVTIERSPDAPSAILVMPSDPGLRALLDRSREQR
jgi:hypothetical protein